MGDNESCTVTLENQENLHDACSDSLKSAKKKEPETYVGGNQRGNYWKVKAIATMARVIIAQIIKGAFHVSERFTVLNTEHLKKSSLGFSYKVQ